MLMLSTCSSPILYILPKSNVTSIPQYEHQHHSSIVLLNPYLMQWTYCHFLDSAPVPHLQCPTPIFSSVYRKNDFYHNASLYSNLSHHYDAQLFFVLYILHLNSPIFGGSFNLSHLPKNTILFSSQPHKKSLSQQQLDWKVTQSFLEFCKGQLKMCLLQQIETVTSQKFFMTI